MQVPTECSNSKYKSNNSDLFSRNIRTDKIENLILMENIKGLRLRDHQQQLWNSNTADGLYK